MVEDSVVLQCDLSAAALTFRVFKHSCDGDPNGEAIDPDGGNYQQPNSANKQCPAW